MSTRRDFISGAALGAASLALEAQEPKPGSLAQDVSKLAPPKHPVIICKHTGLAQLDGAYELLNRGHDTLDACLFITRGREEDVNDTTVGGGLPNEDGVVELDACVMHGPTRRAGAVAALHNIRHSSAVARLVMERTDHLLLVGEGAERFAVAHGFQRENLLTERARKTWLLWKETMSNQDNWGPGLSSPDWKPPVPVPPPPPQGSPQSRELKIRQMEEAAAQLGIEPEYRMTAIYDCLYPPKGTLHVSVVNEKGEMSGATTTSGLAWKLPGRVGDSAIIGAGCFTDQDVGSAGAVGRGEENIKIAGAHTIVENMRRGMSPQEAGLEALRRVARNYNNDMTRLRFIDLFFYILRRDGAYAGVGLWSLVRGKPYNFAVHDGSGKRLEPCVGLFQGESIQWPPAVAPTGGK